MLNLVGEGNPRRGWTANVHTLDGILKPGISRSHTAGGMPGVLLGVSRDAELAWPSALLKRLDLIIRGGDGGH